MKFSRRASLAFAAATVVPLAPAAAQDGGPIGIAMPTMSFARWMSDRR